MSKFIAALMIVLFAGAAATAAPDNLGEEAWQLKDSMFGCKSEDDYSKYAEFLVADDVIAALKFITRIKFGRRLTRSIANVG
jgi:hypothetical protein